MATGGLIRGGFVPRLELDMATLPIHEMKVFLPAKDYGLSKAFYKELGFDLAWEEAEGGMAKFAIGTQMFMLHDWYERAVAEAMYMHILVPDVEQWWNHVVAAKLAERYPIKVEPPEDRPWGIRDFVLVDPSGVLWRIGQVMEGA